MLYCLFFFKNYIIDNNNKNNLKEKNLKYSTLCYLNQNREVLVKTKKITSNKNILFNNN